MTGGTSGLGAVAAQKLIGQPETRMLLGARNPSSLKGCETYPLDLARLADVRSFANTIVKRLGAAQIDALVLNAGGAFPNSRTVDGFETTFAVNHLGHYLLLRLLLPKLSDGARIVMTTSGTHDPAEQTIIPPPRHAHAFRLAFPERDPERDASPRIAEGRAYSSSKLCNLLTACALAAKPLARSRQLNVIAFDPGPTPGTRLMRGRGVIIDFAWRRIGPALRPLIPSLNGREASGDALANLALGRMSPPDGRIYAALRKGKLTFPDPSELARRVDVGAALWRDSAILVGVKNASWKGAAK